MNKLIKITFALICFFAGLCLLPNVSAQDKCISVTGKIRAHAFVENPVGIFNQSSSEIENEFLSLRIPKDNTVMISMDNLYISYYDITLITYIVVIDNPADFVRTYFSLHP